MEIPQGFNLHGSRKDHVLRLKKNLYGQKQAGRVWNQYLHDGLLARGFKQSKVDMCVYYFESVVLMIYVDDGILIGPSKSDLDNVYHLLSNDFEGKDKVKHKAFDMTDEGELADYLGVEIKELPNGTIKLSQLHLIQQIIDDMKFKPNTKARSTPAATTVKLGRDLEGVPFDEDWDYRSSIGKLNLLEKSTWCDLSCSVHVAARYASDPRKSPCWCCEKNCKVFDWHQGQRVDLASPRAHIWLFRRCLICWFWPRDCGVWSQHIQVQDQLSSVVWRLSDGVGLQVAERDMSVYNWGHDKWVHYGTIRSTVHSIWELFMERPKQHSGKGRSVLLALVYRNPVIDCYLHLVCRYLSIYRFTVIICLNKSY